MKEVWKDIKGYEGLYSVSNLGNVLVLDREVYNARVLCVRKGRKFAKNTNSRGYVNIRLTDATGNAKNKTIHRLVAEHFLDKHYGETQVNHINGIKTDNRAENLEWVTPRGNTKHAIDNGLIKSHKYKMTDIKNGISKVFDTRKQIDDFFCRKVCQDLITRACNKTRKTAYGYEWEYIQIKRNINHY